MTDTTSRSADAVISYHDPQTAKDYQRWDDDLSWLLGYPFVPHALGLSTSPGGQLLDLGCGSGEVTRWIAERYPVRVIGADPSEPILDLARRHNRHPAVTYHRSTDDALPFLSPASVDHAMACFVFVTISEADRIHRLVEEVARVLRPGGRFTILSPHPDHVSGASFEGFRRGQTGTRYAAGDSMPVHVRRRDGTWTTITDVYWPRTVHHEALTAAGFTDIREHAPLLADAHGIAEPELITARPWTVERETAPFLLITAQR